jgi:hypothetical protein
VENHLWNILPNQKRKFLGMMTLTFMIKRVSIFKLIKEGEWLVEMLKKISVSNAKIYTYQEIKLISKSIGRF